MTIHFGTDGWRAVISDTFTFANLRLVAQAIADYVLEEAAGSGVQPEVVVGFDTRFLSDRYAAEVARVMAGNNIITWLSRADTPTPAVSYTVKHKRAVVGVMISASHNPPRYNGVKLKASYGGAAPPEVGRHVERILEANQLRARGPNLEDYQTALDQGLIRRFDPAWAYYEHLATLVDLDIISNGELRVIADPMYGSGRGCIKEMLARTRCRVQEIRGEMNPGFGGIHPEPIARYLQALSAAIQNTHADIGLATDGDADRIGAMDSRGQFVDPHHIFALVLRYLVERRGWRGAVVKTVSTTQMVNRLAAQYDLPLHETPVGFNHIADLMLTDDVLIGGEESGGMSIKGHIPEGDGILMGLLLLEVVSAAGVPLHELVADLQDRYGPACYARRDIQLRHPVDKKAMVARLVDEAPAQLAGQSVVQVNTLDGVKYCLADESWLLIRPSGTEPVLRVYAEARSQDEVETLLEFGAGLAE
ncbi:MAG: phosphoglucomutase/phosphomannomutase family protein [Anaerolineae bacterium]|jgi:alpha-D-glucose phosphate-specific phosphoglucomutase|nr:phosphoglucomutase/phosphomannomutase family protein [Anaerolineae bacterium]MDH7475078.1 phosphoglucomutase/phosphomannomutase family protein [Anaerolineae bacterium]